MAKYLVIVESPAKVKTIKKFLGSNYEVMASQGHVRDLPKSQMGIDVDNDYEPKYITIRGKGDILAAIFLCGSVVCMFCDLIARTIFSPSELAIGTVTAVFGAPVVIWLMVKQKK